MTLQSVPLPTAGPCCLLSELAASTVKRYGPWQIQEGGRTASPCKGKPPIQENLLPGLLLGPLCSERRDLGSSGHKKKMPPAEWLPPAKGSCLPRSAFSCHTVAPRASFVRTKRLGQAAVGTGRRHCQLGSFPLQREAACPGSPSPAWL